MDTIKDLEILVKQCKSLKEVLESLGLNLSGTNYKKLHKILDEENITTEHFLTSSDVLTAINKSLKYNTSDVLVEHSTYSRKNLKQRLYNEGLKERKCELCGQGEEWNGKHMSLILDHINGVNDDNRLENLRIVCPNCNATLDTHCGKNIRKIIKVPKEKHLLSVKEMFELRKKQRKVGRPPLDQLLNEINELGYCATGRKYGVSDNAVRKWVKIYELYGS